MRNHLPLRIHTVLVLALFSAACASRGNTAASEGGIERITPGGGGPRQAPYSPAVRAGDFVFFSGVIGSQPGGRGLAEGGIRGQTQQALDNLENTMRAAGVERADLVKCTVFLANIGDYGEMNQVYGAFFGDTPPARSAIGVAGLPAGAAVEIECIAKTS
jgi:2-iminobutanoate/2-iminopropanoate deaminase